MCGNHTRGRRDLKLKMVPSQRTDVGVYVITGKLNGTCLVVNTPPDKIIVGNHGMHFSVLIVISKADKRLFDSYPPFFQDLTLGIRVLRFTYQLLKDDPYVQQGTWSRRKELLVILLI